MLCAFHVLLSPTVQKCVINVWPWAGRLTSLSLRILICMQAIHWVPTLFTGDTLVNKRQDPFSRSLR